MPSKVRINLLVGMVVKLLKMFSKEKSTDMYLQHPLKDEVRTLCDWHYTRGRNVTGWNVLLSAIFAYAMPHHSHWENRWTALGLGHSWSISPSISITLLWHLYRAFVSLECHALPSWRSAQWLPAGHQLFRYPVGDYVLHRKITGSNLWQCDNVTMCWASQVSLTMSCLKSWYCRT